MLIVMPLLASTPVKTAPVNCEPSARLPALAWRLSITMEAAFCVETLVVDLHNVPGRGASCR